MAVRLYDTQSGESTFVRTIQFGELQFVRLYFSFYTTNYYTKILCHFYKDEDKK